MLSNQDFKSMLTASNSGSGELTGSSDGSKKPFDLKQIADWESGIIIYGNKVAIYSVKNNLVGVVIENEAIKQTFMKIFKMLWQFGKK